MAAPGQLQALVMNIAIITGASVGIGRATAEAFMADGYQVHNLSRRPCPAPGVNNLSCDLSSTASIELACKTLETAIVGARSVMLVAGSCTPWRMPGPWAIRMPSLRWQPESPRIWCVITRPSVANRGQAIML